MDCLREIAAQARRHAATRQRMQAYFAQPVVAAALAASVREPAEPEPEPERAAVTPEDRERTRRLRARYLALRPGATPTHTDLVEIGENR